MLFPSPNPIARGITITTRLVDTTTTPMLLKGVESGRRQPRKLATHRFALDDIMHPSARVTPSREWALAPAAGRRRTRTRVLGDCALRSGRRSLRRPIG